MDGACVCDYGSPFITSQEVKPRCCTCHKHQQNGNPGAAHSYCFFSNTINMAGFDPRTDSTVIVLPSADNDRVSLRTTFGPPATALSLVQVVTSLTPSHLVTVSLGPPMGDSFVAGFPVRSQWVLLSSSLPWKVVCVVTSSDESDCSMVCVIFIWDIMPMFLLFSGLNCQEPEKSVRLAANAATTIRHSIELGNLTILVSPFLTSQQHCI